MVSKSNSSHRLLWLATAVIAIGAGLLFTEFVLRKAGYGYDSHFIVKAPNENDLTANPRFTWRYFPPAMAREPVPFLVPEQKGANTKRIVILGDSVAAGFPNTAFGFGRLLSALLSAAEPNTQFEVINAATVALNSHVARVLSHEAVKYDADVIISFLGNTEIVGPYGPGTVFARHTPSLSSIRFRQWLAGTRIGQLRDAITRKTTSRAAANSQWGGMEMFIGNPLAEGNPKVKQAHAHFRRNLKSIASLGDKKDGPLVLLCTVPTNLRAAAPFGSMLSHDTRGDTFEAWKKAMDAGIQHQDATQYIVAIKHFEDALAIDDSHAGLHFRIALCLEAQGDHARARTHYLRARDLDTLRFRADSHMNTIVREVVAAADSPRVVLADAERNLEQQAMSPTGCPGEDFFHEHVHLNVEGHYALARTLLDSLTEAGVVQAGSTPLSRLACADQLALTTWAEYNMAFSILDIVRRPPFTLRFDHRERVKRQVQRLSVLQKGLTQEGLVRNVMVYEKAFARRPTDTHLMTSLAKLYTEFGRYVNAAEMWASASRRQPLSASIQHNLAVSLIRAGHYARAETHCLRAVELHPYMPGYRNNLGNVQFLTQKYIKAEKTFKKAIKLAPRLPAAHLNLGGVYATVGRNKTAIAQFERAIELDPAHAKAYNNLGAVYESMDRLDAAREAYLQALEKDSRYIEAHLNLATLYQKSGDAASAIPHYARVAQLQPNDPGAHYNYAVILASQNHLDDAIRETVTALRLKPNWPEAQAALKKLAQAKIRQDPKAKTEPSAEPN